MTTIQDSPSKTPVFRPGDLVEIVSHAPGQGDMSVYKTGLPMHTPLEVIEGPDTDGDYQVWDTSETRWFFVPAANLRLVSRPARTIPPGEYDATVAADGTLTVRAKPAAVKTKPERPEFALGQVWRDRSGDLVQLCRVTYSRVAAADIQTGTGYWGDAFAYDQKTGKITIPGDWEPDKWEYIARSIGAGLDAGTITAADLGGAQ